MKQKQKKIVGASCMRCTKCCKYFCMEIDVPVTRREYDDLAWIVSHRNTSIHVQGKEWQLLVHTPCRHLDPGKGCLIYEERPTICREHVPGDCERDQRHKHDYDEVDHVIRTSDELYALRDELMRNKRKRSKPRRPR